jgi:N-acetylneuraminate synthase
MVDSIRQVEIALGHGIKGTRKSEIKNKVIARKSLVLSKAVLAGETFTEENLTVMRPGHGMSPYQYWDILGTTASRAYKEGEVLSD